MDGLTTEQLNALEAAAHAQMAAIADARAKAAAVPPKPVPRPRKPRVLAQELAEPAADLVPQDVPVPTEAAALPADLAAQLAALTTEVATAKAAKEAAHAAGVGMSPERKALIARYTQLEASRKELAAAVRAMRAAGKAVAATTKTTARAAAAVGAAAVADHLAAQLVRVRAYEAQDPIGLFHATEARAEYWQALAAALAAGGSHRESKRVAEAALVAYANRHVLVIVGNGKARILQAVPSVLGDTSPEIHENLAADVLDSWRMGRAPAEVCEHFADVGAEAVALERIEGSAILEIWYKHAARREVRARGFFPPPLPTPPDCYNSWHGFGIGPDEAQAGDASGEAAREFLHHVRHRICADDETVAAAVMTWLANVIQNPGRRSLWALVLRGSKGCGKGLLYGVLSAIVGKRYCRHPLGREQAVGRFNGILDSALLVFLDELVWSGDQQAEGVLKKLITETDVSVERKHRDTVSAANHAAVLVASNEAWVVPSGGDERRFTVCDVSQELTDDKAEGRRLHSLFTSGITDIAALLWGWEVDTALLGCGVATVAGDEQKEHSADDVTVWLMALFAQGGEAGVFGQECSKKELYRVNFAPSSKEKRPTAYNEFYRRLTSLVGYDTEKRGSQGAFGRVAIFPPRAEALATFRKATGMATFLLAEERAEAAAEARKPKPRPVPRPRKRAVPAAPRDGPGPIPIAPLPPITPPPSDEDDFITACLADCGPAAAADVFDEAVAIAAYRSSPESGEEWTPPTAEEDAAYWAAAAIAAQKDQEFRDSERLRLADTPEARAARVSAAIAAAATVAPGAMMPPLVEEDFQIQSNAAYATRPMADTADAAFVSVEMAFEDFV